MIGTNAKADQRTLPHTKRDAVRRAGRPLQASFRTRPSEGLFRTNRPGAFSHALNQSNQSSAYTDHAETCCQHMQGEFEKAEDHSKANHSRRAKNGGNRVFFPSETFIARRNHPFLAGFPTGSHETSRKNRREWQRQREILPHPPARHIVFFDKSPSHPQILRRFFPWRPGVLRLPARRYAPCGMQAACFAGRMRAGASRDAKMPASLALSPGRAW